jgi:excisionase family DNA binding protein
METIEGENYFTMEEIADKLKVSYGTVRNYIMRDKLGAIKIKNRLLIPEASFKTLLKPTPFIKNIIKHN